MSVAEIRSLLPREKLQIMEEIWEDLRPHAKTPEVPPEHREILDARRDRAASGKARILDWEEVKHSIGKP